MPLGLRVAPRDPDFRAYLMLAAPLALGASLLTVDEWYDRWFGARLGEGTIATLRYARQLLLIPVALVGQAVATAALPTLSRFVAEGRSQELDRLVDRSLQASLALGVLLGAGLFAVAAPAVAFVYVRGAFTPADASPVVEALRVFAFAVPGWIVQTLAVRPFYARGEMWRPMALATAVVARGAPALRGARPAPRRDGPRARGHALDLAERARDARLRAPLARGAGARRAAPDRAAHARRGRAGGAAGRARGGSCGARAGRDARGGARGRRRRRSSSQPSPCRSRWRLGDAATRDALAAGAPLRRRRGRDTLAAPGTARPQ